MLLQILEELTDTDIEEIWLAIDEDYEKRLPEEYRPDYRGIADMGKRLHFVVQREKKCFGHAVYQVGQSIGQGLALNGQLIGVTVDGNSFDVGTPDMYYRTFVSFRGSDRRP